MIVQTSMVLVILSIATIGDGASFSNVYLQRENPVGYYTYGTPYPSVANSRLSQINSLPSVPGYVAPCVSPCVYPAQTVATVAAVEPNPNVLAYHAKNVPVAVAPTNEEPTGYEYSYVVYDENTGDHKAQRELSDGSVVQGEYSFLQPDGYIREVQYVADDVSGFNAVVKNFLPVTVEGKKKTKEHEKKEPCHENKHESLKEHRKHEESAETSREHHHSKSKESGEEKHHKENKKVSSEESSEESSESSEEESVHKKSKESGESKEKHHRLSKKESSESEESKEKHHRPSKKESSESEESKEKHHRLSKKESSESEESKEKHHRQSKKESSESEESEEDSDSEESKEEFRVKSHKKSSEESREKHKSRKGSKESSEESSEEESEEKVSHGKHKEAHELLKHTDETLVPYKDVLRCIEAAMKKNHGAAKTQGPSPLTYIVLNKPC